MNKKDCENIALILSDHDLSEEVLDAFFRLDERIRSEHELFSDCENNRRKIESRAVEIMEANFGFLWSCRKAGTADEMLAARKQAVREIYG